MSHTNKRKHYISKSSDNDYDDDAECGKYAVGGETYATELEYQRAQVDDYKKVVKSLDPESRLGYCSTVTNKQIQYKIDLLKWSFLLFLGHYV